MVLYCSLHHGPPTWPDKLYELWDGRKACMCCIVDRQLQVELRWAELRGTEAVPDPMDALRRRFLDQLGRP